MTLEEMIKMAEDAGLEITIFGPVKNDSMWWVGLSNEMMKKAKDLPTAFREALKAAGILK